MAFCGFSILFGRLLTICVAALAPLSISGAFELHCVGMEGLPSDAGADHATDIEHEEFRIEYRSPTEPLVYSISSETIEYRPRHASIPLRYRILEGDLEGKIWRFTSLEIGGVVTYLYDRNRGVLVASSLGFTYERGLTPPDETGKASVVVTVRKCTLKS